MAKSRKETGMNIPMCLACVLFCLTLISIRLTSGLYARYTTTSSGNDAARVIGFGTVAMTESGDFESDGKLMIIPGVDLMKKAVVDFQGSESAAYVFAEVVLSSGWTTNDNRTFSIHSDGKALMKWSVDMSWNFLQSSAGKYIYYRELAPNVSLEGADIIADDGKVTVSNQITKKEMEGMTDISIRLRIAVVQSNGFESPEAAWNSLSKKEG